MRGNIKTSNMVKVFLSYQKLKTCILIVLSKSQDYQRFGPKGVTCLIFGLLNKLEP